MCLQVFNKRKKLQQFFKEEIEKKKQLELELKHDEEIEDRALEIYRKAKDRIQKIHKSITTKEKEEKERRQAQIISLLIFFLFPIYTHIIHIFI